MFHPTFSRRQCAKKIGHASEWGKPSWLWLPAVTLPETNMAPENGWLEYFFVSRLGSPIFRCYVSFREGSFWGCKNATMPINSKAQTDSYECAVPVSTGFWAIFFLQIWAIFYTSKWHADDPQNIEQFPKSIWLWPLPENHRKKMWKNHAKLIHASGIRSKSMAKRPSHWALKCLGTKKIPLGWLYFQCIYKLSEMCSIVTVKLIHYLHLR